MKTPNIDPEFRDKIPPLSADEFSKLEENILADGEVREPLVLWHNTIIDGHHRWAIIQKHPEIPYKIKQMDFPDKWAAIVWMCRNQLGRRNITNEVRTVLIGEAYRAQRMSVGNHAEKKRDESGKFSVSHQSGVIREVQSTEDIIAKQFGVGNGTVQRAKQFVDSIDAAERVSPGFRESILSGEVKAPKNLVSEIRNIPEEKRPAAVEAIKSGDTETAKAIIRESKPVPPKKEEPEPAPFTPEELGELIDAAAKALDFSLKQHLVLVHRDVLDTQNGRDAARKSLSGVLAVAQKYLEMIRRIEEDAEEN